MKINPIGRFRHKARIWAGLLMVVLTGLAEIWMFWRLATSAGCVVQARENTGQFSALGGYFGLP